jgi:hypothetical protein
MTITANHIERVYKMSFAGVYPMYIQKAEKKGRTKEEVDTVIFWLTGYDATILKPFSIKPRRCTPMHRKLRV